MKNLLITCFLLLVPASDAFAESSGNREILSFGCHRYNNICYAEISGDPVGPEACKSTSIRWDEKNDANGEAVLMIVSSAFYANRKVNFKLSTSCFSGQPTFPTMTYLSVSK